MRRWVGWENGIPVFPWADDLPEVPDCVKRCVSHRSQLLLSGEEEIHNSGKI